MSEPATPTPTTTIPLRPRESFIVGADKGGIVPGGTTDAKAWKKFYAGPIQWIGLALWILIIIFTVGYFRANGFEQALGIKPIAWKLPSLPWKTTTLAESENENDTEKIVLSFEWSRVTTLGEGKRWVVTTTPPNAPILMMDYARPDRPPVQVDSTHPVPYDTIEARWRICDGYYWSGPVTLWLSQQ